MRKYSEKRQLVLKEESTKDLITKIEEGQTIDLSRLKTPADVVDLVQDAITAIYDSEKDYKKAKDKVDKIIKAVGDALKKLGDELNENKETLTWDENDSAIYKGVRISKGSAGYTIHVPGNKPAKIAKDEEGAKAIIDKLDGDINENVDHSKIKDQLDNGEQVDINDNTYLTKDGDLYQIHSGGFVVQKDKSFDKIMKLLDSIDESGHVDETKNDFSKVSTDMLAKLIEVMLQNQKTKDDKDTLAALQKEYASRKSNESDHVDESGLPKVGEIINFRGKEMEVRNVTDKEIVLAEKGAEKASLSVSIDKFKKEFVGESKSMDLMLKCAKEYGYEVTTHHIGGSSYKVVKITGESEDERVDKANEFIKAVDKKGGDVGVLTETEDAVLIADNNDMGE